MTTVLSFENVRRVFTSNGRKIAAVDNVSVSIRNGETLGIVGESGSGKSTLGRIAVGLETESSGSISVGGIELSKLRQSDRRQHLRKVQMVFQDPYSSLNAKLTVGHQIEEVLRASGQKDTHVMRERMIELFQRVGMSERDLDKYPHEFSGGQRQRIAIARALAPKPEIVVADEPVSAVDVAIQAQILDLFESIQRSENFSCLFISHDIAVVARLSDRIAVMQKGRVVEIGTTEEVIRNPQHEYSRLLLNAVPRFDRRRNGDVGAVKTGVTYHGDEVLKEVSPTHSVLSRA